MSVFVSNKAQTGVWIFLVLATLSTLWIGESRNLIGSFSYPLVIGIALLKGRAIILYFMEVRRAPVRWRLVFELWIWGTPLMILIGWYLGG